MAVHGGYEVIVDDGFTKATFTLDDPSRGLYVRPMIWRDMINFSPTTSTTPRPVPSAHLPGNSGN